MIQASYGGTYPSLKSILYMMKSIMYHHLECYYDIFCNNFKGIRKLEYYLFQKKASYLDKEVIPFRLCRISRVGLIQQVLYAN